jgi:phosphopantothenoylcysteine decarboxylase/phosphopantothenate--cysteine ligase
LEPTLDILAELGRQKAQQMLVGFAVETQDLEKSAQDKLRRKKLDLIVANEASAFDAETSRVTIFSADGTREQFPELSKRAVAVAILERIGQYQR